MSLDEFNQINDDNKKTEMFNAMNKKNKFIFLKNCFQAIYLQWLGQDLNTILPQKERS